VVWLKFAACVVVILFSGTRLAQYGDAIAERTGLGRVWIGLVALAIVTSIPELVTSISAVTLVKSPDLAVGNVLGSCTFNLTLLALADVMYRPAPVLSQISSRHLLSIILGIVMLGLVASGMLLRGLTPPLPGKINAVSVVIVVFYLAGIWWIYRSARRHQTQAVEATLTGEKELSRKTIYLRFALAAAAIIGGAIWLSLVGNEISETYGWHSSFVGSLFVAVTTSLPELVVTVAAVRLSALDMAAANIFGSNMFDLVIISAADFAYRRSPIFAAISSIHLMTIASAVAMNAIVIAALRLRPKHEKHSFRRWYDAPLVAVYVISMIAVYRGYLLPI
jgi:cation:H+ antiporter